MYIHAYSYRLTRTSIVLVLYMLVIFRKSSKVLQMYSLSKKSGPPSGVSMFIVLVL